MSKISKAYYKEVDPKDCSVEEAAEFYYLFNLLDTDDSLCDEYEKHETNQLKLRNRLIGEAIRNKEVPNKPDISTAIMGISTMQDKVILLAEY